MGGGAASHSPGSAGLRARDEDIATLMHYTKQMVSLTAQRKMIQSASDYELIRARRLLRFVFGYLRRVARAAEFQDNFEELGRRLQIVFGRPAVPILVAVLRKATFRREIMSALLLGLPHPTELAAQARGPSVSGMKRSLQ
jgi:hypothetical protein